MRYQYIEFMVNHQTIKRVDNFHVVGGSRNYLRARFTFSADWDQETPTAVFYAGGVTKRMVVINGECEVPWEILAAKAKYFFVSCFCGSLITTDAATVEMTPGAPTTGKPPTPSEYAQLIAQVERAVALAENAAERAAEAAARAFSDKVSVYIELAVTAAFKEKVVPYIDEAINKAFEARISNEADVAQMLYEVFGLNGGELATDEEVGDIIDGVFGDETGDTSNGDETTPDGGATDDGTDTGGESSGEESGDEIATDEEVKDLITDIFG